MDCNLFERCVSSLTKTCCVRVFLFLLTLSSLAIYPAPAQGATPALQLTVTNWNGSANDGQVSIGQQITLTAHLIDIAFGARTWKLEGGGALAPGGNGNNYAIYTAPLVMPADPTVTVTVSMTSTPTVKTSYKFTLINPVPTLASAQPPQAVSGTTTSVTLDGTGFVPG